MAANVRRGVAKPRAGVDPFQSAQAPQWLVEVRAKRLEEKAIVRQRAAARQYAAASQSASLPFPNWDQL